MNETIPHMKTIKDCLIELKKLDPHTAITIWFITNLCKDGKVKHFLTGKKVLVNYDDLINFLNNGFEQKGGIYYEQTTT